MLVSPPPCVCIIVTDNLPVAFQLESTDGVTVIVYATTTAPLLAQLPADSGGCDSNMEVWLVYGCSFIRGYVGVYGSSSYGTTRAMV